MVEIWKGNISLQRRYCNMFDKWIGLESYCRGTLVLGITCDFDVVDWRKSSLL